MSRPILLLTLVATGILAVVLVELSEGMENTATGNTMNPETPPMAAPSGFRGGGDQLVAQILARPLFNPDRVPATGDEGGQSGAPVDTPRLSGILVSSELRRAIFQTADDSRAVVVEEGKAIGGWQVQHITSDSVIVIGAGGTRRLKPYFDQRLAPASALSDPAPRPLPPQQFDASNFANQAQPGLAGADPRFRGPRRGPSPDGSIFVGASGQADSQQPSPDNP